MKNLFKSKTTSVLETSAQSTKAILRDRLFSEGTVTLENPKSEIKELLIKEGRLYALVPITASVVNSALVQESFWQAEQSREVIESYE